MNVGEAYSLGTSCLCRSTSPDLDARLLLEFAAGLDHAHIVAFPETVLSLKQEQLYLASLKRAAEGEPIPYITGRAYFAGFELIVTPDVLIPRPETENLVNEASAWMVNSSISEADFRVVDVGTGSGCIAIALAAKFPHATIIATDVSTAALEIASINVQSLAFSNQIRLVQGHLLESAKSDPHLVVANLPYITDREWSTLDDSVKWYEPALALRGGINGLDLIADLLSEAKQRMKSGTAIFLEIGWEQGAKSFQLARNIFPRAEVKIKADLSGNDRILCILV